jgi:hypothetical protein
MERIVKNKIKSSIKEYFWNILVWATQTLNVFTGGNPDQPFSGRTGIAFLLGKRWGKILMPLIDWVFEKINGKPNHCINSIEWDRVKSSVRIKIKG